MKKNAVLALILFMVYGKSQAQCTNPFYEFKEGTKIYMQSFDDKDQLQGKTVSEIKNVVPTANGYQMTMAAKIFDKDNEIISDGEYGMECDNGTVKIDLSGYVPAKSLLAFGNMEIKMEMKEMEMPASLSIGQKLKDASLTISTVNSPFTLSMTVDMKNRLVEGKEDVTTPAGTFECYKLTYDMIIDFMMGSMEMKNVQYITEKLGAVRTETYDSDGKLLNYTVLQKVEYK